MAQLHPREQYPMVTIPAGRVKLRDDRIKKTWTVELDSFGLSPVPVTEAFYSMVMQTKERRFQDSNIPVANISWYDAIHFCNALSRQFGLKECYSVTDGGEQIHVDREARTATVFPLRRNGNMHALLERLATDTVNSMISLGITATRRAGLMLSV